MNRYKSIENRQQLSLMPMCLDDMVALDNVVRAIDTIVDILLQNLRKILNIKLRGSLIILLKD